LKRAKQQKPKEWGAAYFTTRKVFLETHFYGDTDMEFSHYHCSAEWHLARLRGKGAYYAPLVLSMALHLGKKSGVFSASIPRLATYFKATENTIRKAIHILVEQGFLEVISKEDGASICYLPLTHKEWAAKNPGRCTEKESMPWSNEPGDTLGVGLYAISGGRFRPYPNFVKAMRNTGLDDSAIVKHFRNFVQQEKPVGKKWNEGFSGQFIKYLRDESVTTSNPSQ
jgi:hypothetical protein